MKKLLLLTTFLLLLSMSAFAQDAGTGQQEGTTGGELCATERNPDGQSLDTEVQDDEPAAGADVQ